VLAVTEQAPGTAEAPVARSLERWRNQQSVPKAIHATNDRFKAF